MTSGCQVRAIKQTNLSDGISESQTEAAFKAGQGRLGVNVASLSYQEADGQMHKGDGKEVQKKRRACHDESLAADRPPPIYLQNFVTLKLLSGFVEQRLRYCHCISFCYLISDRP